MKDHVKDIIASAIDALCEEGALVLEVPPEITVEHSRGDGRGDFATAVALGLARVAKRKPRDIAELIVERLPNSPAIVRVEIAGPGFINFHLARDAYVSVVRDILGRGARFARSTLGGGRRIQVEFVSANPTGPLHVGHGRGAAYGASLANLLEAAGYDVQREYYINDAGRQMHILALSVWLRYLEGRGVTVPFPSNGYRGAYIRDLAGALDRDIGAELVVESLELTRDLPADAPDGDKEVHVDALIARARAILGGDRYERVFSLACDTEVDDIRDDLEQFGVSFDAWFSERSLVDSGAVTSVIERLRERGHLFEKDGALWFRSTAFGDEKDRVVVRDNGESTYFASDIAYAADKFARGFERAIYIWGADHHGYVARVKAAVEALGLDRAAVEILLVQFAILYRGGERAQMSTRSGEFVTLRELRAEVGTDAARFFYAMRRCEQHLDFDLELAKSQSNDNPVYYVQYAHARIASVLRQCAERGLASGVGADAPLEALEDPESFSLMSTLAKYPQVLASAADVLEPHQLATYLRELATELHGYYNTHVFLVDDERVRGSRLSLAVATQTVLADGLSLLGVSAPESMMRDETC